MKKIFTAILSFILITVMFSACVADTGIENQTGTAEDNGKTTVITTVFPVYDWARNIAGENCNVIYLDKSGADMHSFEPTTNDIITISKADIFIHIGGASDEWVENAVKSANNPDLVTLSLMSVTGVLEEETVAGMQAEEHDHEEDVSEYDEHIWLSLKKAQIAVDAICETLCGADGANSATYRANAEAYNKKLAELDGKFSSCVKNAKRNTVLFADRFPFRYLTEDYGIEYFAAFPGCSAETEASFETLTFLIEKTKELSLPCIIVIENSESDIAETVSGETGAKIISMNSCQSVTQKDIDSGLTYISAMENNLNALTEALG